MNRKDNERSSEICSLALLFPLFVAAPVKVKDYLILFKISHI